MLNLVMNNTTYRLLFSLATSPLQFCSKCRTQLSSLHRSKHLEYMVTQKIVCMDYYKINTNVSSSVPMINDWNCFDRLCKYEIICMPQPGY